MNMKSNSKCSKAQSSVMLYSEKQLKPFQAVALHRHLHKCSACRELFIEMDEAFEPIRDDSSVAARIPADFTAIVMNKIHALPDTSAKVSEARHSDLLSLNQLWMIPAFCLAIAFALLYSPESGIAAAFESSLERLIAFMYSVGQGIAVFFESLSGSFGNMTLVFAIVLAGLLAFVLYKETHAHEPQK